MAKKTIKESNAKAVIALLVSLLAFAIFVLFYTNKDTVLATANLQSLVFLIVVGMGFLVGLLYLVNPRNSSRKRK